MKTKVEDLPQELVEAMESFALPKDVEALIESTTGQPVQHGGVFYKGRLYQKQKSHND